MALEFALVVLPFLIIVLFIFALGSHLFYQELLDTGLFNAVRQIQTGNAQNIANGNAFITGYLCPAMGNLVNCGGLSVSVTKVAFSSGQDFLKHPLILGLSLALE